jgi:hypothetical protein
MTVKKVLLFQTQKFIGQRERRDEPEMATFGNKKVEYLCVYSNNF